jgi:outer membrane immunogenic protein
MHIARVLALAGGLSLAVSPAWAADLPPDGRGYSLKDYSSYPGLWQGRYAGVTLGAGGMGIDVNGFGTRNKSDIDGGSVAGGVLVGYNMRNGPWIGGIEADLTGMAVDEKKAVTGLGTLTAGSNFMGTVRLRGGYAWERLYLFASAGLAVTDIHIKSSLGGDDSFVAVTPALGIGAEFAFNNDWAARVDLIAAGGSADVTLAGEKRDIDFGESTLLLGLTRRF